MLPELENCQIVKHAHWLTIVKHEVFQLFLELVLMDTFALLAQYFQQDLISKLVQRIPIASEASKAHVLQVNLTEKEAHGW